MLKRKHAQLGDELEARTESPEPALVDSRDADIGDDLLSLIFTACHPVLSREARVALTLRLLGGLSTDEIARAFLVAVPPIAERIVRAKRALAEAHVPFEVPRGVDRAPRLASVLEVIYLIFNRATRQRRAITGPGLHYARTHSAWAASSPSSHRASRRSTASSPSWRFRHRGSRHEPGLPESPCCCWTRTERAGTGC
jgi:predicted RNA polymerase sigma factor